MFEAIVQQLEAAGHEVHLGKSIQSINMRTNKQIDSITTSDNTTLSTDWVVSAVQTPQLVNMLPTPAQDYKANLIRLNSYLTYA